MNINFVVAYTYTQKSSTMLSFEFSNPLKPIFDRLIEHFSRPYKTAVPLQHILTHQATVYTHMKRPSVIAFAAFDTSADLCTKCSRTKDMWIIYVGLCGDNLKNAPEDLKNDIDVVKAAVQKNGLALAYASLDLQNNPYIVLLAVTNCGLAYLHASECVKSQKHIALAACRENIAVYPHLPDFLKLDQDILSIKKHYES